MMNFSIIIGITSGAAFLLGFLLIAHPRKVNITANRYLGLFVITVGLALIEIPLFYEKFQVQHPKLFEIIGLVRFLTAPFLYISIVYFTSVHKKFNKKMIWHFLPFLVFALFRFPFFITGKNFEFNYETGRIVFFILGTALPLQTVMYWFLSFWRLEKHIENIRNFLSDTATIDLLWLRSFLLVIVLIVVSWLNLVFFNVTELIQFTPFIYLISLFFLAYFSLQQKEIFDVDTLDSEDVKESINDKKETPKRLSESRLAELNLQLQTSMNERKLYLDNQLNLPALAKSINASCNDTSFAINELYGDNFYNFVNKYRIEEAKKLLLSTRYNQLNILGIAYESGFNSKTTFNTTFKKYTGCSPREFLKANAVAENKV